MKDILLSILQFVLIVSVPALVVFVCRVLKERGDKYKSDQTMSKSSFLIGQAYDTITSIVACVGQTYVDNLKKSGKFTPENQREALEKAYDMAQEMISKASQEFIAVTYGSFSDWAHTQIEREVRAQKIETGIEKSSNPVGFVGAYEPSESESGDGDDTPEEEISE